jgi:hypothetical protein
MPADEEREQHHFRNEEGGFGGRAVNEVAQNARRGDEDYAIVRRDQLFRRMWFGRHWQNHAAPAQRSQPRSLWDYAPWLNPVILVLPLILFVLTAHSRDCGSRLNRASARSDRPRAKIVRLNKRGVALRQTCAIVRQELQSARQKCFG